MKKGAPQKIRIEKIETETLITIATRDKTSFDIVAWIFCISMIIFSTAGMIIDKTKIYMVIPFYSIMLIMFLPVLASYFTLKETATIRITENNLIIQQKRPLFSYRLNTEKKKIYCLEFNKVGLNTEPFNAYIGFRSALNMFSDRVPYLGVKGNHAKSIFKYHDLEIREWIFEYLKNELKIKN